MRRGTDQQRRGLHLGAASEHRGSSRLVPGGVRLRSRRQLLEVHQAGDRLVHDSVRSAIRVPRGDLAAAGRRAVRDSAEHSLSPRRRLGAAQGRARVHDGRRPLGGRPGEDRSRARDAGGGRASADRMRRRRVLVAGGRRDARVRRADEHPDLRASRRPGRRVGRASAGDSRRVQEAVHRRRRRGRRNRLPLLERRAFRAAADLDRQGQVHPDRSDADANRMAGQRGPADGRRSEDRAATDDQAHQGTQARLLEEQELRRGSSRSGRRVSASTIRSRSRTRRSRRISRYIRRACARI